MVAKISTGGNMFGALAYNQNKVDSEEAKVLFSNKMLLSEDGNFSIGECMRSFEMQMPVLAQQHFVGKKHLCFLAVIRQ